MNKSFIFFIINQFIIIVATIIAIINLLLLNPIQKSFQCFICLYFQMSPINITKTMVNFTQFIIIKAIVIIFITTTIKITTMNLKLLYLSKVSQIMTKKNQCEKKMNFDLNLKIHQMKFCYFYSISFCYYLHFYTFQLLFYSLECYYYICYCYCYYFYYLMGTILNNLSSYSCFRTFLNILQEKAFASYVVDIFYIYLRLVNYLAFVIIIVIIITFDAIMYFDTFMVFCFYFWTYFYYIYIYFV